MRAPRKLLICRPQDQAEAFAAALEAALPGRFAPVIAPLTGIVPVPAEIDLSDARALLFTSANGVAAFAAASPVRDLPALCVGEMTARAAREAGFEALAAEGDVERLAALVLAQPPGPGVHVHVRGRQAAGDLTGRLLAAGVPARGLEIYRQVSLPMPAPAAALLAEGRIPVVAAFSPRSALRFARAACAAGWPLGGVTLVSLSAAADAAHDAPEPGRRVLAAHPGREGMIAALAGI